MSRALTQTMSKTPPVSLGTFQEIEARAIARQLTEREGIKATLENLRTISGATTWWHIYVHPRRVATAEAWLRGYRIGRDEGRSGMRAALHGKANESRCTLCNKLVYRSDDSEVWVDAYEQAHCEGAPGQAHSV